LPYFTLKNVIQVLVQIYHENGKGVEKRKKIIESIRQMVGRKALAEWLQKYGDDFAIEL